MNGANAIGIDKNNKTGRRADPISTPGNKDLADSQVREEATSLPTDPAPIVHNLRAINETIIARLKPDCSLV
jgi:hypothetical protein